MKYLLLSVLCSTAIFITFKISERFKANLVRLISFNYLVAAILGFSFNHHHVSLVDTITSKWFQFAAIIGVSYIVMFFFIGYSTRKAGLTVTTIATKLSMVVPIFFSLIYFGEKNSTFKTIGLVMAAIGVFLSCFKPVDKSKNIKLIALPVIIFIGSGITDSVVKYAQNFYVPNHMAFLFPAIVFAIASIVGLLVTFSNSKSSIKNTTVSDVIAGTILGVANFGSLYFFIMALNNSKIDSSIVFGLNNLGIVLFALLFGLVLFHEKFSKINFAGIIIAVSSILILISF